MIKTFKNEWPGSKVVTGYNREDTQAPFNKVRWWAAAAGLWLSSGCRAF